MSIVPDGKLERTMIAPVRESQVSTGWLPVLAALFMAASNSSPAAAADAAPPGVMFEPPAKFAGEFGEYSNLLKFNDGRPVRSPEEWANRRREIKESWTRVTGAWPALLQNPKLEVLETTTRDGLSQQRVRVEIAPGAMAAGYLLIPPGQGPFPAAFVPFYDPETSVGLGKEGLRDFAYQLARRGFVTLSIGSPGGDARRPKLGEAICQPLSYLAYVAANCHTVLAQLRQVDPERIGVVGHSYGGKWALFAACLYEKYACGVWSDPGIVFDESRPNVNYWEPWYLGKDAGRERSPGVVTASNPRTGAYRQLMEDKRDLHELLALMAPRPFLVSGGSEDPDSRWLALNRVAEVYRLLGATEKMAMTTRPDHSPNVESNEQIYWFFERFLKAGR
jgi:hypothetical protein